MNGTRISRWGVFVTCVVLLIAAGTASAEAGKQGPGTAITSGKTVSIELTLTLADESVFFSNVGSKPLTYTHGENEIVRGLETALEGMHVGERKHVTVPPNEGFGIVSEENFHEVPKEEIPSDVLEEGAELQGEGPHGEPVFFRVAKVKQDTVVLDFNHPLAGQTLFFDVTVLDIQ